MTTKVVGPSLEEIKAKMKEVGIQRPEIPGAKGLDHLAGDPVAWAEAVKAQADAEWKPPRPAPKPPKVKSRPLPRPLQIPTRLKAGMTFDAWGNTCCIESVEGDLARCRVVKLDDPHARGADRPQGWPSSYWDEGKVYTLRRHPDFPDGDEWYFDNDEMKRNASMLLVLVEASGRITFDMDS